MTGQTSVSGLSREVWRFLLCGGLAAAINWVVRFPLSSVLPIEGAIVVAYFFGMSAGFYLYRTYVFPGSDRAIAKQGAIFIAVNLVGAVVVLGVTVVVIRSQSALAYAQVIKDGLAHGVGIAIGAVTNFFGHRLLTFRRPVTSPLRRPTSIEEI